MFPLAEVIFASRILGLVAGQHPLDIQAEAHVRSVEVLRDGTSLGTLRQPPWKAMVDFGPELKPHELTVIARDQDGNELGRDTQPVNVARPPAELGVVIDRNAAGELIATVRSNHYAHRPASSVTARLDGRALRKGNPVDPIALGKVDDTSIHVLEIEVTFTDSVRARKEVVFGGQAGYAEQMPAELTAVAVRQRTKDRKTPKPAAGCFRVGDDPLPVNTVEPGDAMALFIFNGVRGDRKAVGLGSQPNDGHYALVGTPIHVVEPVAQRLQGASGGTDMFSSVQVEGRRGTRRLLGFAHVPKGQARIADAAGAAAAIALREGKRRVVVIVLGDRAARDESAYRPENLRRYLQRVGVPLRVWSIAELEPGTADGWGEVIDVSTSAKLLAATEDLRRELESQRIAWIPVSPLNAFRIQASADCAFDPLAVAVQ